MENQPITENKYLVAMRKANKKYREANKERFNNYMKEYYHNHMKQDEFKDKCREKARRNYHKRKLAKKQLREQEQQNNSPNLLQTI